MKIYIASSWRNQHAVELLTAELRRRDHEVVSFVERTVETEGRCLRGKFDIDEWIASEDGREKFEYDIEGATKSDLVIYVVPAGIDAWAEVGAAWSQGVPIIGLYAKGEQAGLVRRMIRWMNSIQELEAVVDRCEKVGGAQWLIDEVDRVIQDGGARK